MSQFGIESTDSPPLMASGRQLTVANRMLISVVFVAILATAVQQQLGGFRVSGWAWLMILIFWVPALVMAPVSQRLLRLAVPMLAYLSLQALSLLRIQDTVKGLQVLGLLAIPTVVFLALGGRISSESQKEQVVAFVARLARLAFPAFLVIFFVTSFLTSFARLTLGWFQFTTARPAAMSLVALFAMAQLDSASSSHRSQILRWVALTGFMVVTGSRMGLFVALLAAWLILSQLRQRARFLFIAFMVVAVGAYVLSPFFSSRWTFGRVPPSISSVSDVLAGGGGINTSGRAQNWPRIYRACENGGALGLGVGAAREITLEVTQGATTHPHNEFLRHLCDGGYLGSFLYWSFYAVLVFTLLARRHLVLAQVGLFLVAALFMFALTDNVTIYAAQFTAPAAIVWSIAVSRTVRKRSRWRRTGWLRSRTASD